MQELGYDMSGHAAKGLKQYLGNVNFSYIITVCANAEERCPIFPGVSVRLHWPFDDPAALEGSHEQKLALFRRVRDQLSEKIKSWLAENP
jgi:arsenate reductase